MLCAAEGFSDPGVLCSLKLSWKLGNLALAAPEGSAGGCCALSKPYAPQVHPALLSRRFSSSEPRREASLYATEGRRCLQSGAPVDAQLVCGHLWAALGVQFTKLLRV